MCFKLKPSKKKWSYYMDKIRSMKNIYIAGNLFWNTLIIVVQMRIYAHFFIVITYIYYVLKFYSMNIYCFIIEQ